MLCADHFIFRLGSSENRKGRRGRIEKNSDSTDCFSAPPIMSSLRTGGHCALLNTDEAY